ncbi:uncharacterized protein [Miscanthus floridulus]|uniref:uncharacterized protein n=1 Tax=Miscanthus floridulus TaxID=154761 RepID=UPI003458810B
MPRLNRVFEELGIGYWEREVPAEVLASIDKKKKKASTKNVTVEAESKKRKGASVARAPAKKKKKSVALVIAAAASSVGSVGVASTSSEDVQSSSVPSVDVWVTSDGDHGSPGAPVRPVRGAMSGAERPEESAAPARLLHDAGSSAERSKAGAHPSRSSRSAVGAAERPKASAAPARSLHGAASVAEQPEASAADPMPDIFGELYSSSEEGTEVVLQHAPSSPAVVAPPPALEADVGQPEAVFAEQAPAAQSSLSPPPTRPWAKESRPFGPSPHDRVETSAQGARQAAQPGLFMSDVMAGLLTPEERTAATSVRFGLGQPGPMAPSLSSFDTSISGWEECYLGVLGDIGALRLSLVEKEQETEALRTDLAKARDAEALFAEQAHRGVHAATIGHYQAIVVEFGGKTSAPLEEDNVYALASWLKRHLAKLPGLINGCTDYGALAGVANYAKLLDAQKSLAGRPPPVPCSATAGDASATACAPVGAMIGSGDGRRPQAPSPPIVDVGSIPGTSAIAEMPEVPNQEPTQDVVPLTLYNDATTRNIESPVQIKLQQLCSKLKRTI